jgi:2-methylisocitrate lyase-like PEP mutase family enzyme
MMGKTSTLHKLMETKRPVVAPGVYNALTAKLAAGVGFDAVYMTGYGTAAAARGLPDLGLLTMTEMLETLRAITDAVGVPVIADADTGYGNALNVARTVREYEKAGAAALHIEDQIWPKRCGHMTGKQVIPRDEMVAKVQAATDSRMTEGLRIIARTDALAVEGWEAAMDRAHAYVDAGADIIFVEAPETVEQMERVPREVTAPCLINMGPRTPALSVERLGALGYAIAIFPGVCLAATIQANLEGLRAFKRTGQPKQLTDSLEAFMEFNQFLGASQYADLEKRYEAHQQPKTRGSTGRSSNTK